MRLRQLRIIRNQNGLTQQQVAEALGISRSAYCGYETGRRSLDIDTIAKLSKFYNLSIEKFVGRILPDYFYDDMYYEDQPDTRYLSQLTKEERDLIVKYRIMKAEGKSNITLKSED